MRNVTVIATCLVNMRQFTKLEEAEFVVRKEFERYFPMADFDDWNRDLNEHAARHIIASIGKASMLNVEWLIGELSRATG